VEHLYLIFAFVLGTVLGSFYNVVIHRLKTGMSIVYPPSHCPVCKTPIRWYDNIPIISYIILRGKCRHCKSKISLRYPIVELSSGILALICLLKWGISFSAFVFFVFFSLLLMLSLIDWDTFELPDSLNLGGLVFGLLTSFFRQDFSFKDSIIGALVGAVFFLVIYLYYIKVRKFEGLGFGDVKLLAFIGSVTGVKGVFFGVFLGSVFGLLWTVPILIKNKNLQFAIPYGPFISLGCFVATVLNLDKILL